MPGVLTAAVTPACVAEGFRVPVGSGSPLVPGSRESALLAGDGQARDLERGCGGLVAEGEVAPDHLDVLQNLAQVAGNGDLLDRVRELPTLDPEPDGPPGIVTGGEVDPEPDQLGHVESLVDGAHDLLRRPGPRLEEEVGVAHRH